MTKYYKLELIVREGNDEFWEDIEGKDSAGCDEVQTLVYSALTQIGLDESTGCELRLVEYHHEC